jgi:hypothetical protein
MCARAVSDEQSVRQLAPQLSPPGKRPKRRQNAVPLDTIAILTAYSKKASELAYQTAATITQSKFYT